MSYANFSFWFTLDEDSLNKILVDLIRADMSADVLEVTRYTFVEFLKSISFKPEMYDVMLHIHKKGEEE